MSRRIFTHIVAIVCITAAAALSHLGAGAAERVPSPTVRIGMIESLFRDVPETAVLAMMRPFAILMETQTGVSGQLVPGGDCENLGRQLAEDKVQLAVFHGIEFAWARQKFPELRPLMIAINQDRHLHANLVTRSDSPCQNLADLRGKALSLAKGGREHCQLFLERRCSECGQEPQQFFAKLATAPNVEEALDDVVDNLAQATIVDGVAFDCYKRRKPGRFAKLKVVQQSEIFPAAVIAYKPGTIDEITLQRFREGMVGAGQTALGRQLLTLWKLTGFEHVPADYEQTLTDIVKSYPRPTSAPVKK